MAVGIFAALFVSYVGSVTLNLSYSAASVLWPLITAALAPSAVHRVESPNVAGGLLMGLAFFASFPVKRYLKLDGFVLEGLTTILFAVLLFVIALGWKRD